MCGWISEWSKMMDVVYISSVYKEASDPWSLKLSLLFCAFLGLLWKAQVTWAGKEKALGNRHLCVPPISSIHGSMQGTAVGCLRGETWLDQKRTASWLFPILEGFKTGTWVILRAGTSAHLRVPEEDLLDASKAAAMQAKWPWCGWLILLIHPSQPGNLVDFWSSLRFRWTCTTPGVAWWHTHLKHHTGP